MAQIFTEGYSGFGKERMREIKNPSIQDEDERVRGTTSIRQHFVAALNPDSYQ